MFVVRDTKARGMKNALKNYCSEFRMPPTARKTNLKFLLYLIAIIVFEVHHESKEVEAKIYCTVDINLTILFQVTKSTVIIVY